MNDLCFEQSVDRFGQSIVKRVSNAADRPGCLRLVYWLNFKISLSSLRSLIWHRSRLFSLARSKSFFGTTSVSRCAVIHLFSVNIPTPESSATYLHVNPLVSAIRPASCRNSSVRFSGRSSSAWTKYADALRRISLACFSPRISGGTFVRCLCHHAPFYS